MLEKEPDQQTPPAPDAGAGAVIRPDSIPETFWDGEKNTPKFDDIGAALTERETLRTAAEERAKQIPAKPEDYKFDLTDDFQMPEGFRWKADAKEPIVAAFQTFAVENKLTQPEVTGLVKIFAANQVEQIKAQQAFDAEQTKQLGDKAADRRAAAKRVIAANFKGSQAELLGSLLTFKDGVELVEALQAKLSGVEARGGSGDSKPENLNADLSEQIGKVPMGRKLLDMANGAGK